VCVCSLALVISHAHHIFSALYLLSSASCLALQYFSTLPHKWHMFRKNLMNIQCVFWVFLQLFSETYLILRRIQEDINIHRSSWKVPIITVRFYWNLNFLNRFLKKSSNMKFNENPASRSQGVPRRWTERQTYMTIVSGSCFLKFPECA